MTSLATPPEVGLSASVVREPAVVRRTVRPVHAWAFIGALLLALEIYVVISWVAGGRAVATPTGSTPVPQWMKTVATIWQPLGLVILAVFLFFVLVRPWLRQRRITLDGMFCLVFLLMYWEDPLSNYFQPWFTFNTSYVNLGAWNTGLPGWMSPHGSRLGEAFLLVAPLYVYAVFAFVLIANRLMAWAEARWPRMSRFELVLLCFVFLVVADIGFECPLFMMLGAYCFAGTIPSLTVFYGHYYQYPIYEGLIWGALWTGWACLRYFRNDKGQTLVERGIEKVRTGGRSKTVLRFLALSAACNLLYIVVYNIPMGLIALRTGPWPADITKRSYLTDGLCGPGTTYACPSPSTPVAQLHSAHVAPSGVLIGASRARR